MADLAIDHDFELSPPLVQGGIRMRTSARRSAPLRRTSAEAVVLRDCCHEPHDADALRMFDVSRHYRHRRVGHNNPVGWGWTSPTSSGGSALAMLEHSSRRFCSCFRQKWRTSINRAAEAMTLFAVASAGIYPLFHTGRPWRAIYWLFPLPNSYLHLWQNFRSPLMWDVFAVSTYATVSALFWFTGLIPDLATLRDRATNRIRKLVFGLLSLGWRGSASQWRHYELAYLILAGLSTPLVSPCTQSCHSILLPRCCPAGTRQSFLRTLSLAQFSPASRWL